MLSPDPQIWIRLLRNRESLFRLASARLCIQGPLDRLTRCTTKPLTVREHDATACSGASGLVTHSLITAFLQPRIGPCTRRNPAPSMPRDDVAGVKSVILLTLWVKTSSCFWVGTASRLRDPLLWSNTLSWPFAGELKAGRYCPYSNVHPHHTCGFKHLGSEEPLIDLAGSDISESPQGQPCGPVAESLKHMLDKAKPSTRDIMCGTQVKTRSGGYKLASRCGRTCFCRLKGADSSLPRTSVGTDTGLDAARARRKFQTGCQDDEGLMFKAGMVAALTSLAVL